MQLLNKFSSFLNRKIEEFGGAQYKTFGVFGVVNYPLGYFLLQFLGADESFMARFFATVLCFPLIFVNKWPSSFKKYVNTYWFITLLYCLPVFTFYTLLMNQISTEWLLNFAIGLFILFLLVDYILLLILYGIGIPLAYLLFILNGHDIVLTEAFPISFIYLYSSFIIIACLFTRNKERLEHEKLQTIRILAGAIAHEMRTPLLGIAADGKGLGKTLPSLLAAYKHVIQEKSMDLPLIPPQQLHFLPGLPERIQKATEDAFITIDMLLMKLKDNPSDKTLVLCSINDGIRDALEKYPLDSREKQMIRWEKGLDFHFMGSPLFIEHIFLNLLKNALFYVKKGGKGHIEIRTAEEKSYHVVYFKDTGPGMDSKTLDRIFDHFYTKTAQGTGIGLAFCKKVMKDLGGHITCRSRVGEWTEFKLEFPKLKNDLHSNKKQCIM